MKCKYRIVYAQVTTYRGGMCWWATHYYVKLAPGYGDYDTVELEYKLSVSQADKMTQADEGYTYREGESSSRFTTEQKAIDKALEVYKDYFPDADLLILGSRSTREPRPILAGPSPLKEQVTAMYEKCEELGWWDGQNEAECLEIEKEWRDLMGALR